MLTTSAKLEFTLKYAIDVNRICLKKNHTWRNSFIPREEPVYKAMGALVRETDYHPFTPMHCRI